MKKLNVTELREELLNEEMSFMELDNFMMESGYLSTFDDGITEAVKESDNIVYCSDNGNFIDAEVQITFEITIDNGEDEAEDCFILKVLDVEEF